MLRSFQRVRERLRFLDIFQIYYGRRIICCRYGAEIVLRQRLEEYIAQKQQIEGSTRKVPVVGIIVEGGTCAIRAVLDYVTKLECLVYVIRSKASRLFFAVFLQYRWLSATGVVAPPI